MEILAWSFVQFWDMWLEPVLLLVVGLGLVVFVHELGHFLIAKRVGIKVERFALGFGPRLFGIRRGETDYCVRALFFLGGYVKMLGQEDFTPLTRDQQLDPRSYEAKSVSARLAVISAGVVMNVILGAVLFIIVGLVGKDFSAPVVGGVMPTYPACKVDLAWSMPGSTTKPAMAPPACPFTAPGLEPGDEVLELGGKKVMRFQDLLKTSSLASGPESRFAIVVRRKDPTGQQWIGKGRIGVRKSPDGSILAFGVYMPADTVFGEIPDAIADSPFRDGDRLLAINGQPIQHHWQIAPLEKTLDGSEVTVTAERDGKPVTFRLQPALMTAEDVLWLTDGSGLRGQAASIEEKDGKNVYKIEVADGSQTTIAEDAVAGGRLIELLDILGMIPRLQVELVTKGSPAEKAGLRPLDIVTGYGDHGAPSFRQFLQINNKAADDGTDIVVLRDGQTQVMKVKPKMRKDGQAEVGVANRPDLTHAVLAAVRDGSPAARAGLTGGDAIEKINGRQVATWIDVFNALRGLDGQDVTIAYRRGARQDVAEIGRLTKAQFDPADYKLTMFTVSSQFKPLMTTVRKPNPVDAMAWGAQETWDIMASTYATLRALVKRTASTKALVGPAGIVILAVKIGREQAFTDFLYFLAFISACIAVINFLPLPVFDGGHAVFLLLEKIRGKPLPAKVLNVSQLVGLALILLVFVLLTWQDIARWVETLW